MCSLAAERLQLLRPGVGLDEVRAAVERDYDFQTYSQKNSCAVEFHIFLSRMAVGVVVLTTFDGDMYLGRIAGEAEQVESHKAFTNLRRDVEWMPPEAAVDYNDLPEPVSARLSDQNTVVDLTAKLDLLEAVLPESPESTAEEPAKPEPVKTRDAVLADASDDLTDELLLPRDFLQEHRPAARAQALILHGRPVPARRTWCRSPPGT